MTATIMTVFGTRPEAIKLAPVLLELAKHPEEIRSVVAVTAQHRELLDTVLDTFGIVPHYDLNLMRRRQDPFSVTARALRGLKPILEQVHPDLLLVQGDTTTVLAGALAAFYLHIPIAHVEAGLRTANKEHPFPEEMNRRLTTVLADLHFAPTEWAKENLRREGIPEERIFVTGNTVIDALLSILERPLTGEQASLLAQVPPEHRLLLATAHRRESWGEPLHRICQALRQIVEACPDLSVLFSVHPNPAVRRLVQQELGSVKRILVVPPIPYAPFVHLMRRAYLILTDSGGIQEEATALGKPTLVLREVTERPEGVDAGILKVVGRDRVTIATEALRLLKDPEVYQRMARISHPYGDGKASQRIVRILRERFAPSGIRG